MYLLFKKCSWRISSEHSLAGSSKFRQIFHRTEFRNREQILNAYWLKYWGSIKSDNNESIHSIELSEIYMVSTICPLKSTFIQNRDCQNSSKLFCKTLLETKIIPVQILIGSKKENEMKTIILFICWLRFFPTVVALADYANLHDYSPSWARDGGSGENPVSRSSPKRFPSVVRSP